VPEVNSGVVHRNNVLLPGEASLHAVPVSIYRQGTAARPEMGGLRDEESAEVVVAASNEPGVAADG
jgi:hypothetical protein